MTAEASVRHLADVDEAIQLQLLRELTTYLFVGGMPESVRTYRDTRSLVECFQVQSELIGSLHGG